MVQKATVNCKMSAYS